MVRFAHLADCHLGAWRDPHLRSLMDRAFATAVNHILNEHVDFVVLAGDLFNTALPGIDHIKHAVHHLGRLRDAGIPLYFIAGSHDYSPTGRTMLDVLQEAGLGVNVFRGKVVDDALLLDPVIDPKTGVKLCGILGKAGQLDRVLYEKLAVEHLEKVSRPSIFLFHTALRELSPRGLPAASSHPLGFLPKGFSYYAGGHVHTVTQQSFPGYSCIAYPGPLYPTSFSEIEELRSGGFYIVDLHGDVPQVKRVPLALHPVISISLACDGMSTEDVQQILQEKLVVDVQDALVLIRLTGQLSRGTGSDINFRSLFLSCERRGAFACMKNAAALRSPRFEEVESSADAVEDIEQEIVANAAKDPKYPGATSAKEEQLMIELMKSLSQPQGEAESKKAYEERVIASARATMTKHR